MKLTRKPLTILLLGSVVVRKEIFKPFHSYRGYHGIASKFELSSLCMLDVVKIQCTKQRLEKFISSLIRYNGILIFWFAYRSFLPLFTKVYTKLYNVFCLKLDEKAVNV